MPFQLDRRYVDPNPEKEVNIVASYKCNNNCLFCCEGWHRNLDEKSTSEIKNILQEAKKNKVTRILFMGGEPSVRTDIIDLVSYAKDIGFKEIFLISNGRMFSYTHFTKKIIDAGMTNVLFSLLSHKEKIHDELTRSKGSFNQIVNGIKNVKKFKKIIVGNNTTVTKLNYQYLPELAEFLVKLLTPPWDYFEFIHVNPFGSAWDNYEEIVPELNKIAPYVHRAIDIGLRNNIKVTAEAMPFCHMNGYEKYVTELQMSEERAKITPKGDKDDLNLARKYGAKVKSEKCMSCRYEPICEGLWKNYAKKQGFSELEPVKGKKINTWDEFRKEFFHDLL
ncbi:radical SAM protein [Candidatus Woesearchaeota archaeon]|nr:radical SAM protein [Candidatus Woesearchaeota archaeon]